MMLYWIAGVLLVITLSTSGFFFALHLGTNEPVPLQRARLFWRWSMVVLLGSFDWWIFSRVFAGLRSLF
jgi:hypothetical protein